MRPLVLVIEVKLNSGKSSVGENDQLAKYLKMLDDPHSVPHLKSENDLRCLIYLTRARSTQEIKDSVKWSICADADRRIFGLEWRDVLDSAEQQRELDPLLDEVFLFLTLRGFAPFAGFRSLGVLVGSTGRFYDSGYFVQPARAAASVPPNLPNGQFYWSQLFKAGSSDLETAKGSFYAK